MKNKNTNKSNADEHVEKLDHSCNCGRNVKLQSHSEKEGSNCIPGSLLQRKIYIYVKIYIGMFTALSTIAKTGNNSNELLNKWWYMQTMEY